MENQSERRSRLIQTIWLTYAFFLIGFDNGILGPVLIDLQYLVNVSLETISNLFIVQGVGFIVGIITAMVLEKYVNLQFFIGLSVLFGSVINIIYTIIPSFIYLVVMTLLQCIIKGFLDFGILTMCNILWKDNKSFAFQLVAVGGGVSSFVVPFIVQPFLSQKHLIDNTDSDLYTLCHNRTNHQISVDCYIYDDTNVQWAYVIVGLLTLPPAISFIYYYRRSHKQSNVRYEEFDSETKNIQNSLNTCSCFFLLLLFIFHIPVFGFCLAFGDLLTEFGVLSEFQYTKSTMAILTAVFWGSFVLGRSLNLVISKYINLTFVLIVNLAGLLCGVTMLVLTTVKLPVVFWLGTVFVGVFSSSFLPTVLVWSDQYVAVNSVTISTCLMASGIGEIILPRIGGAVIDTEGPRSIMIMMLITALFEVAFFIGLAVVGNVLLRSETKDDGKSQQIINE